MERAVSEPGRVVNPTVVVFVVLSCLFYGNLALSPAILEARNIGGMIYLILVQSLCVYMMFGPLHDSVHGSASKKKWLNEAILHGTSPFFLGHGWVWRPVHIAHHAFTNDPVKDPDHFASGGTVIKSWLRSTLLFFYYFYYAYKQKPRGLKRKHWVVGVMLPVVMYGAAWPLVGTATILFAWILPTLIGLTLLSYTFTTLPHYPGEEKSRFRNTRALMVPKLAQWAMLNQHLHVIHHLYPLVPWYDYVKVWKEKREELLAKGVAVRVFSKRVDLYEAPRDVEKAA